MGIRSDRYNDNYRYILSAIDVFSKFLHLIPIETKSGPLVASAFRSIFYYPKYWTGRRPVWVRTDKGKEILNKHFQDILRDEGILFQVCEIPTSNVRSWNACIARFAIESTSILHIEIHTDIYRVSQDEST